MPLISIIIVVFNAVDFLEETIVAVANQNYTNIDLIIIDGGSADGTVNIIKKYEHYINYWISEPDNGIYDAMNKGIAAVKGNWVYFLGAGDIILNVLDQVSNKLKSSNTVYYGDVYRKDTHKIYNGKFSPFKLAVTNICHQAIFYPISVLRKYKYETKYRTLADHDLNMRIYGDKDYSFVYIPILISIYNGDGFSVTNNIDKEFFKNKIKIIQANFPFIVFCYAYSRRMLARILKH